MSERIIPSSNIIERFDGSCWHIYHLPNGGVAVVTEKGREIGKDLDILAILNQYKQDATNHRQDGNANRRKWFDHGGNSDVFEVKGTEVVVKEASTSQSVIQALDRMDYLHRICEQELAPNIRVPDHYAAISSSALDRQYLIMKKANAGLTVEDILQGEFDDQLKVEVETDFSNANSAIKQIVQEYYDQGLIPYDNLTPDFNAGNVIVDFTIPTEDRPYTLWVIDQ